MTVQVGVERLRLLAEHHVSVVEVVVIAGLGNVRVIRVPSVVSESVGQDTYVHTHTHTHAAQPSQGGVHMMIYTRGYRAEISCVIMNSLLKCP